MSIAVETKQIAVQNLSVAYQDGGNPQQTAQFYSNWAKGNNYEAVSLDLFANKLVSPDILDRSLMIG